MKTRSVPLLFAGVVCLSACFAQDASPPQPEPQVPVPLVNAGWKSSWSPDGQRLVYGVGDGEGLEVLDLRLLERTKISNRGKDPIWSPTGEWIAFVREEVHNEIRNEEVWLVRPDGRDARRLGPGGYPSWASDGESVYALRRDNWQFTQLDAATGKATGLSEFRESYYPALSPDGRLVAFGADRMLKVVERESGRVVHSIPAEHDRGLLPAWSPDGRYVGYGGYDADSSGLRVLEVATGRHAMIWAGPFTMPAWTADGARVAFDLRSFANRSVWQVGRRWVEARLNGTVELPETDFTAAPEPELEPDVAEDTTSLMGKPAPDFLLKTLLGKELELSSLIGKPVVLDFWATWCPPCRRSLPHLNEISENAAYRSKGLHVLAVNLREQPDEVERYMKDHRLSFTVPMDFDGSVAKSFRVEAIPTTLVIDRQGRVADVLVGFGPTSTERLDAAIRRVLE